MTTEPKQQDLPSAVEFEPPLACVRRILKNSLPSSTNVGKDASAAFARACGIFIIYVTSCANDFAREHKRQTITANDVLAAIKELDFDEFTPDMMSFLENYRAVEKSKKDAKAAAKQESKGGDEDDASGKRPREEDEEDDGGEPDAKRVKQSGEAEKDETAAVVEAEEDAEAEAEAVAEDAEEELERTSEEKSDAEEPAAAATEPSES